MSDRSRDQYTDTRPKNKASGKLRWTGQFMVLVTPYDTSTFLAGTWWDPDSAQAWADAMMASRPGWHTTVFELQFKDFWLPFQRKEDMVNVSSAVL